MTAMTTETIERAHYVVDERSEDNPACWLDLIWPIDGNDGISGKVSVMLGPNHYSAGSAVAFSAVRRAWIAGDGAEAIAPRCDGLPIVSWWIDVGGHRMPAIDTAVTMKDGAVIAKVSDTVVAALLQAIAEGALPTPGIRFEGDQADRVFRVANPVGMDAAAAILAQVNIWRWRSGRPGGGAPCSCATE